MMASTTAALLVAGPDAGQGLCGFVVKDEVANGIACHHATFVGRTPTPATIIST
jgi:hypothetical protein